MKTTKTIMDKNGKWVDYEFKLHREKDGSYGVCSRVGDRYFFTSFNRSEVGKYNQASNDGDDFELFNDVLRLELKKRGLL
jgi:hypothetical protein